jgi:hypothetical protein
VTVHLALRGRAMGGEQPISAATIQIYSVGPTTDGGPSTALINQITTPVTTSDGTGLKNANANAGNGNNQSQHLIHPIYRPCLRHDAGDAPGACRRIDPPHQPGRFSRLLRQPDCDQCQP